MAKSKSSTPYRRRKGVRRDGKLDPSGDLAETALPRYEQGTLRSLRTNEGRAQKWLGK